MRCNDRVAVGSRPTVFVLHCFIALDERGGCVDVG